MGRVLVTGSAGFIGQVLMPLLAERGWDAVGLDADYYDGCDLAGFSVTPTAIRKDIREVGPADLASFDAVIHLAGLSNDPVGDLDRELTLDINLKASVRLAEMARAAGVKRFVFSSSCSVYGARSSAPVTEDDPLEPLTAYAVSKVATEQEVSKLATADFCPVFLRNATVYGASARLRLDLVVNNLVGWAHTSGAIRIMSDGSPWRPLIHVADVSAAFAAALEAPAERVSNQSMNIGTDEQNYTVRQIAEMVLEAMPEATITFSDNPPADNRSYRVDFSKARRLMPEFKPSWSLAAGIVQLRDAYLGSGLSQAEFDGDRYTRLKRIQSLLAS